MPAAGVSRGGTFQDEKVGESVMSWAGIRGQQRVSGRSWCAALIASAALIAVPDAGMLE
jgi:hypothetical protein